ncbi:hypothetical protein SAY87_018488 [Trapa incisa]|uniref:PCI domain-containing protein n=1 Tax=Trapa incisa TaxID=236973 RepID=A0AAN7L3I0_9MYRT|nr:hypothetical protein SAY87_018488 [Trapa incisa]
MNQAGNTEALLAPPGTIPREAQNFADTNPGPPTVPSTIGSDAQWNIHRVDNGSIQNGFPPNTVYNYQMHTQLPTNEGMNGSTAVGSLTLAPSSAPQDYSAYSTHQNSSADSYGYATTGYTSYYSSYQQQTSHSYSQPIVAYPNTGHPYQPLSSFQNTGSYAAPANYSSTYYNPGDYQTSAGYPTTNYSNQASSQWNEGNYANYSSYQYSNYAPNSAGAYGSVSAPAAPLHYQPQHPQYYGQSHTEVTCAPGTENLSVSATTKLDCHTPVVPGVTRDYSATSQPQQTSAVSWRPEATSFQLPPQQPTTLINGAQESQWNYGASGFTNHQSTAGKPEAYQPFDTTPVYANFQEPQNCVVAGNQGTNLQYHAAHQVPQTNQFPSTLQASQSLDSQRVSKFQIQTNPRIVSNLGSSFVKTEKAGSGTSTASKPAYVSVSLPNPSDKVLSSDASDSALKSGTFPKSLRGYVERTLARCKNDAELSACQGIMKEMITSATADGTLYTRDWDTEPLFPLPSVDEANKVVQYPVSSSTFRSPTRRAKSRWEPLQVEKPQDRLAHVGIPAVNFGGWKKANQRDKMSLGVDSESTEDRVDSMKLSNMEQNVIRSRRPFKRQRIADKPTMMENGNASSDSDKEQSLSSSYSTASSLSNTPEERKRRENRSKRFEKVQGNRTDPYHHLKTKDAGMKNLYTRRATAMVMSKNLDNRGSEAVEDMDWDALTVKGTCQEIEKRYLRLTSAPDPATVRPEDVLEKALAMVQISQKNYLYKCDQLKSIRQDLTVQRIRNGLTVKVYETHARLALEYCDLSEYNQCQSQLKTLYTEGIEGCHMEFSAYSLLCVILHSNNYRDLLSLMSRLPSVAKEDKAVKHALAVRAAVTAGNYIMFFKLYKKAPNLNSYLMDLYVDKMRYMAVCCMSKSYRPNIPVSYISRVLGFACASSANDENEGKEKDGIEECTEWLKAHGACLVTDSNGELQFDAKASSSSLYIPEPEDAVAHGDANLAVDDFLARATS